MKSTQTKSKINEKNFELTLKRIGFNDQKRKPSEDEKKLVKALFTLGYFD